MQKRHRIFIAINLPAEVKKQLAMYEKKFSDLPARWTRAENLHITLIFLGELFDEQMGMAVMAAKEVITQHKAFDVSLTSIAYGPEGKLPPRMLWAMGEKSSELSALRNDLQKAFEETIGLYPERQAPACHVTLARVSAFAWRQIEPEERPEVNEKIDLLFTVESIEVMESALKKGGPRYTILESILLRD